MKDRLFRSIAFAALGLMVLLPAAAQTSPSSKIPRAADGKPDLSGIWQAIGVSLFGETGEVRPGEGRASTYGPRESAPYQSWAMSKVNQLAADNRTDPNVHCKLAGVPRITGIPVPFEIVQTPKKTVILYESNHAFRIIPSDGKPHPPDLDPTYMGDSIGRWDGDTFVVDVTGFNDKTWLPGAGHFHTDQLHVVERFKRNADDTISYEATMEDAKVLAKPWTYRLILRHPPRDERIMEADCSENNQDLEHIVKDK
jgi:hypothetical protein